MIRESHLVKVMYVAKLLIELGFSTLLLKFGGREIFVVVGYLFHCRIFISILGLYLLDTSCKVPPVLCCDSKKCLYMSSGDKITPSWEPLI